jgi:hypothetical protein
MFPLNLRLISARAALTLNHDAELVEATAQSSAMNRKFGPRWFIFCAAQEFDIVLGQQRPTAYIDTLSIIRNEI